MSRQRDVQRASVAARSCDSQTRPVVVASRATLADQMVSWLARAGIDTYFGVPGGAIEPLFNALARSQREGTARLVPTRSEGAAAFAADGFYRETGRIAACTTTTGPGISNLITAVMSAHADRIPLLVLTPQTRASKHGRGSLQDSSPDGYDLTQLLGECTRYSSILGHPDQLAHKLGRVLSCARGMPMGPVHLSVPSDLLAGPPSAQFETTEDPSRWRPRPVDLTALHRLTGMLARASAPAFYIGDDAGPSSARLCEVAARRGVPVFSSPAGKRWLDHFHSSYAGVLGFSGHEKARRAILDRDLIVAFGATFDELSTNSWTALPNVPILSVDCHLEHVTRLPNAQPVLATLDDTIAVIADCLGKRGASLRPGGVSLHSVNPPAMEPGPVHPATLMAWLGSELPEDVVVHVDTGAGFSWSTRHLKRRRPNTYRVAMGLGSMGWAISAVIGSAVASGRRSICVCGDGAMLMSSLELTAAVAENLPVTYIILNDSGLGMVRHGQALSGSESIGHEIPTVRFDKLARACGARGYLIESADGLHRLPRCALTDDTGGPCVIDVRIDRTAVPPIVDRIRALEGRS